MTLRDRVRAGDIWVEGSRAFRAFDDFLLPLAAFAAKRNADELGLAVPDRFETWRDERLWTLSGGFEKWQNWPLLVNFPRR
jgi:hypothetical protein